MVSAQLSLTISFYYHCVMFQQTICTLIKDAARFSDGNQNQSWPVPGDGAVWTQQSEKMLVEEGEFVSKGSIEMVLLFSEEPRLLAEKKIRI